jgi:hypothetical protein
LLQGNNIYGEIPEHEVEAKSPLLEENSIYVISHFRVSNAKSGYMPVDSPYMVEFTLHTTISAARTNMHGFPEYAYKITPIDGLCAHVGDTKNFLGKFMSNQLMVVFVLSYAFSDENKIADTVGILVEVSEAYRVRLPNKPAPTLTRHVILRNLRLLLLILTRIPFCFCKHV